MNRCSYMVTTLCKWKQQVLDNHHATQYSVQWVYLLDSRHNSYDKHFINGPLLGILNGFHCTANVTGPMQLLKI